MKLHSEAEKNSSSHEDTFNIARLIRELKEVLSSDSFLNLYNDTNKLPLNFREIINNVLTKGDELLSLLDKFVIKKPKSEIESKSKGKQSIQEENEHDFEPDFLMDRAQLTHLIETAPTLPVEEQSLLTHFPDHLLPLYTWLTLNLPQLKVVIDSNTNATESVAQEILENLLIVKELVLTNFFELPVVDNTPSKKDRVSKNKNKHEQGFFITTYPPRENSSHPTNEATTPSRFKTLIDRFKEVQKNAGTDDAHKIQQVIISLGIIESSGNEAEIDYVRTKINQLSEFINKNLNELKTKSTWSLLSLLKGKPQSALFSLLEACKQCIDDFNQNLNALEVKLHNQNILPPEIIQHVVNFLDYRTQVQLSRTCHFFNLHMQSALEVNFISGAAGFTHTVLLKGDGTAWGCGGNEQGQLGLGDQNKAPSLQKIPGLPKIKQVVARINATLFLGKDGTVWGCGNNDFNLLGLTTDAINTPIQIPNLPKVKRIAIGLRNTIFIAEDGSVFGCGDNSDGQLGLSHRGKQSIPMKIPGLEGIKIKQAAVGFGHLLLLEENGEVWGCGSNLCSQLGLDSRIREQSTPIKIRSLNNIKQIAAGNLHSLFLRNDGTVEGCGSNLCGQLGFSSENEYLPLVTLNISDTSQIVADGNTSIIVKKNKTVWACGDNYYKQLGFAVMENQFTFTQLLELTNINYVVCGYGPSRESHTLFLGEGVIYGCGSNSYNQLGDSEKKILKPTPLFQFSSQKTQETNEIKPSGP